MRQYHIGLKEGEIAPLVLMPGSPNRVEKMAKYLEHPRFVTSNREYCSWTGSFNGKEVSIVSTGIGGPSAAIALEELINIGAHTFIRTGTCGSLQPEINRSDLVIATAAVRETGTANAYVPLSYPAVADHDLVQALTNAAKKTNQNYFRGIVQCKDAFFLEDPSKLPLQHNANLYWETMQKANVLASEMESDTLFIIANIRKVKAATLLISLGAKFDEDGITGTTEEMIKTLTLTALNAITSIP